MHTSVDLNQESEEESAHQQIYSFVTILARVISVLDRHEVLRTPAHLALSKVKLVEEVFDLGKN